MSHTVTVSFGGLTGSATRGSLEEACRIAEAEWSRAKYQDEQGARTYDKSKHPQVHVEVRGGARWKAWMNCSWNKVVGSEGCGMQSAFERGARMKPGDSAHIFNLAWRIAKKGQRF